jgi:spore germination protein YaaH
MDSGIAAHLAGTDLSTLALFSVTTRSNGKVDTTATGYKRIVGSIGQQLTREAHARGVRVELVYTSFGLAKNTHLFGGPIATRDAVIASLVALVEERGFDGINVDVELLDPPLVPAYGDFVGRLRTALQEARPAARLSVATTANERGAAMAAAAVEGGVDRVFLMGYDYHWSGSAPGASAPIDRRDGSEKDLAWSLELYRVFGVPVQKTILGLPLYGMEWPVVGPELGALQTGKGTNWIPSQHLAFLLDPAHVPTLDDIEQVEQYAYPTKAAATPRPRASPSRGASPRPTATPKPGGWRAIYVDSPATLRPKLALADVNGLAGVGFWAMGYERGLPGYSTLIADFRAGRLD